MRTLRERFTLITTTRHAMERKLVQLRALVGFLGEDSQFGWWDTSFLSDTGQRFLGRTFPRSAFAAGLHSTTTAARQLHDKSVGKGNVEHLFRLSPVDERKLSEVLRDLDTTPIRKSIEDRGTALEALDEMSRVVSNAAGAIRVGRRKDLLTSDGLGTVAGYYHQAFTTGAQAFPYFSDA